MCGGDLKERNGMSDTAWARQHLIYERMARAILNCPTPIIGVINGAAYGGGCELVAAVDFAYVAEGAKFAQTEVKFGIIPGAGGTQTLALAIGERRAKELILTGQVFDADQALDWGLANAIYPLKELMPAALATAQTLAENAPIAVRQAKTDVKESKLLMKSTNQNFLDFNLVCDLDEPDLDIFQSALLRLHFHRIRTEGCHGALSAHALL